MIHAQFPLCSKYYSTIGSQRLPTVIAEQGARKTMFHIVLTTSVTSTAFIQPASKPLQLRIYRIQSLNECDEN